MRPPTEKRSPRPAQLAADRRRREIAQERVKAAMAGMLDGLDLETRMEACRAGIRVLAQFARNEAGEGRAVGLLSGAAAEVAPAFEVERKLSAAEALFRKGEE